MPLRHSDGHLLGILSVDEPNSGLRAGDEELDVLAALSAHAALAVQAAQETADAARHRLALEELLAVSSRLTAEPAVDEILRAVCSGIRDALGFQYVSAQLVDKPLARLEPRASVGWELEDLLATGGVELSDVEPLLDSEFEIEGCYLLPNDEARKRIRDDAGNYDSHFNGRGPHAWDRHWLLVPLRDAEGELIGLIWADEPADRLLPSAERLQALRIFANQAAAAIVSAAHQQELRFLADHDPLTRLLNRRAFVDRLDGEVARANRYGRSFALVLCDLDGFKELNDRYGHSVGDEALQSSSAGSSTGRFAVRTRRSASAATSSRCCSRRRARRTRAPSSDARPTCSRRPRTRGSRACARATASRRARPTQPTRRRCSGSPTRRSTSRSGTAAASSSSPRPNPLGGHGEAVLDEVAEQLRGERGQLAAPALRAPRRAGKMHSRSGAAPSSAVTTAAP